MNKHNIPQEKKGAELYLKTCKAQLEDTGALIFEGKVKTLDDINKAIWTDIHNIDLLLEGE